MADPHDDRAPGADEPNDLDKGAERDPSELAQEIVHPLFVDHGLSAPPEEPPEAEDAPEIS